jgi:hypothetical protein
METRPYGWEEIGIMRSLQLKNTSDESLELTVRVININYNKSSEVFFNCKDLKIPISSQP